ncbi:Uncharacterised protein [Mycobacteroides abscessus subsp. abscessus]|nr:Uncharacterised protein [Mycobacteroides abscessus subsp. abscessus]
MSAYGPPPTMTSTTSGISLRINGRARMSMSCPLRGTNRDRHRMVGASPSPNRARNSSRATGFGAKRSVSTPGGRYSSAAARPKAEAKRFRVYLLT